MTISPTQSNVTQALRAFLTEILPIDNQFIRLGQQSRASEPLNQDFVVITPIRFERIATNQNTSADCKFTASILSSLMTVTEVARGTIPLGALLFGIGMAPDTTVEAQGTGRGGVGTYTVSPSQNVASTTIAAGQTLIMQEAIVTIQIDVHGPNAGDNAQTISTLFRDAYAVDFFAALEPPENGAVPLLADDPHQIAFQNAEQAWEWRWILEAKLQLNQTVVISTQFADAIALDVVSVEERYPTI